MNVRPQAIGSKWTVTCRKRLIPCLAVKPSQFYARFWNLECTYNIIIKIVKAYHNDLVHNTYTELNFRLNFPQLCVQFCCFRFTIDFHKHLNIQWATTTGYGGIIILGKEGNKTPSSMNEELPSNERIVGSGAAGRDGLQQCKFSLNGMTSSFVSLVAGYAQ